MSGTDSKVIVVTSGKGGVGKTTTSANIGVGLSKLGKKVILLDTDIGLRNLDVVLGVESKIVYDLVDVVSGVCDANQAIIKDNRFEGLYVIPAAQTKDKDAVNEEQMINLCCELKKEFDYIVIDCPAGIEQGFKNAIAGADIAIVVATPDLSSLRDADRIVGLLEDNGLFEHYLLINRIRPDLVKKGDMLNIDEIIDLLGINLIGVIPDDEDVIVSTSKGEPVVTLEKSKAGLGYRNISLRLDGKSIPLMEIEKRKFFKFFSKRW